MLFTKSYRPVMTLRHKTCSRKFIGIINALLNTKICRSDNTLTWHLVPFQHMLWRKLYAKGDHSCDNVLTFYTNFQVMPTTCSTYRTFKGWLPSPMRPTTPVDQLEVIPLMFTSLFPFLAGSFAWHTNCSA